MQTMTGKVLFLGDSVTDDGKFISFIHSYLLLNKPECQVELINAGVSSETASGLSEPSHPFPRPCVHDRVDHILAEVMPEIVVVCYGMNDGIYYPLSEERFNAYKNGMKQLINKIHRHNSKAIVVTPPPFDAQSYQGELGQADEEEFSFLRPYAQYDEVLRTYSEWIMHEMDDYADQVIDLHRELSEDIVRRRQDHPAYQSGDGIHPNLNGHWVIARLLMKEIFRVSLERFGERILTDGLKLIEFIAERDRLTHNEIKEALGHTNPHKAELLPANELEAKVADLNRQIHRYIGQHNLVESVQEWHGYQRHDYFFQGYEVIVIKPLIPLDDRRWIWRMEFFGAFDEADREMASRGWHLVYIRMSDLYGGAEAVELMSEFHEQVVAKYELSDKPVLIGFSRGGLYALHYAAKYDKKVSMIYMDAPVIDIRSWPGGKGSGKVSRREWKECKRAFHLSEQSIEEYESILESAIARIANENIPMILVAGDSDDIVPYDENGQRIVDSYRNRNATFEVILKPGIGHHPHGLNPPDEIVRFITDHAR
ncbi:alpha/beta fold hydrolase [Cohnella herbarum]|uniref:Prolyl oligopeptidase family serine peptidase n=1 Tax=Cohnella herbarum TaxID=2728023 RepID=A0A7Z2VP89_9BACL|nr:alpha/beta fold hydrolase [Cohnella herbarum]QJD86460.1 prolyl oligopeptidase family serine peptidase [Cohnella herbarum]